MLDLDPTAALLRSSIESRSMHAPNLVAQFVGLHRAAIDISTTSTVKVVGQ